MEQQKKKTFSGIQVNQTPGGNSNFSIAWNTAEDTFPN
jgi:hypothetical protein